MSNEKYYRRFSLVQRIEHWLVLLSFTALAVTGLPQKFAGDGWAEAVIAALGGIENVRVIHHIAAAILLFEAIYHGIELAYKAFVLRVRWTMFPQLRDVTDALSAALYNIGLSKTPPKFDHFSFAEKAEYWALVWGTAIMALTGFMLWNPITTSRALPGDVIPAAKAAHGAEAILAVLAILVWHVYNVHLKTFNQSMFTGKLNAHEMEEEHALELERLAQDKAERIPSPEEQNRSRRIFIPIAAVVSLALLFGVYLFLTAETTAITTLPKQATVQVFAPRTPTPARISTPLPGQATPTVAAAQPTLQPVLAAKALPASHAGRSVCQVCHATGVAGAPKNPPDHASRLDASCTDCHKPK